MIQKIFAGLILALILIVNSFRFWQLDQIPYGYNVDEMAGAVSVACLSKNGIDANLKPRPIFLEQNFGTPKPPVYAYPAALWTKFFGYKVESLRGFTAFFYILTILGLFFLSSLLAGPTYGLLTALIASISPWAWMLSRIGYESTFCAAFITWGIFFFIRMELWRDKIISALLFASALYVYPPVRLHTPLIILSLFILQQTTLRKRYWLGFGAALIIACIPLIIGTINGSLQSRFNDLSIFNEGYLSALGKTRSVGDLTSLFMHNFSLHFTPSYLFQQGDPSYEHSTLTVGLYSWLEWLGFLSLMFFIIFKRQEIKPYRRWLIFLAINYLLGFFPASLTNSGLPSSLRTFSVFPFSCLLGGFGLWLLCKRTQWAWNLIFVLALSFSLFFLKDYFGKYREESKGWFSFWTKEEALNAKTEEDWLNFMVHYRYHNYHVRYYLMNYHGDTCEDSNLKWNKFGELLNTLKVN